LGNFFTVRDLLDRGIPGEVIRFVFLSTHYSKPMDWTEEKANQAEKTLRKWRRLTSSVAPSAPAVEVVNFLKDDLNSHGALDFLGHLGQVLFQKAGNTWDFHEALKSDEEWMSLAAEFVASAQFLGILTDELGGWTTVSVDLSGMAQKLAALRAEAMQTKDFSAVDAMKAALVEAGVEVRMSKDGVELVPGAGFDAARLEALA
jgi:cysteinyl-tRNA synthetase